MIKLKHPIFLITFLYKTSPNKLEVEGGPHRLNKDSGFSETRFKFFSLHVAVQIALLILYLGHVIVGLVCVGTIGYTDRSEYKYATP